MSFWDRMGRVLEALDNQGHYGAEAFSHKGRLEGRRTLMESQQYAWFDLIVPGRDGNPFSIPAVIWAEGSVFVVDFRRWKGSLCFQPVKAPVKVKKKFLWWDYEATEEKVVGTDHTRILKEKEGNYGEDTFYSTMKNPLGRPKAFLHALKDWLGRSEPRWRRLHLYPVVAFIGDEVDLGEVRSIDAGIVLLEDMPELVRHRRDERFAASPSRWICDGLDSLPSWDRLVTRTGDVFQGRIIEPTIGIETNHGDDLARIPEIEWIDVNRNGIFSERDDLVIHFRDGSETHAWCQWKSLHIDDGHGPIEHKVRNLSRVVISLSASDLYPRAG